jgi:hypothetical protein
MSKIFIILLLFFIGQWTMAESSLGPGKILLKIETTALNFDLKMNLSGYAKISGDKVQTSKLRAKLFLQAANSKDLVYFTETGMGLRDQHAAEYLGAPKFDEVTINGVSGDLISKKGFGMVTVKDISKKVEGTIKLSKDKKVLCAQFIILPSWFGISADYKLVKMKDKVVGEACVPVK